MWLFLSNAAVSIVSDRDDPARLLVRGRRHGDIEAFLAPVVAEGRWQVSVTPDADYLYRAFVPRDTVARAVAAHASAIGYPNFKNSVHDGRRHSAYSDVWSVMHAYQEEP
ncbi:hypothetical protein [Sulfuritalea sp.]|uniref:hypothetical protein n=1 Tax=Sulfuritalea sp. TaxID=2480090 RepID=UPI001AC1609A|nr:hypothetical protein [Sulfuritalea sp.]MBN8474414.1 hypothetical protein [Sulfuritalea sp.]